MSRRLPHLRSALQRLMPGPTHRFARFTIRRTAEHTAERHGAQTVHHEVLTMHGHRLSPYAVDELRKAIERDLPEEAERKEVVGG